MADTIQVAQKWQMAKKISVATHFKKLTTGSTCLLSQLLSKVTVTYCSFFSHQMLNVSALLLGDALLKCVATEVVLFSVIDFKTLTFHRQCSDTLEVCWDL